MTPHEKLIDDFYSAFHRKDHEAMAACYHPQVVFNDPVFSNLKGWKAAAMWRMLCERGKDLELTYSDLSADEQKGSARWEAHYTFSQTGRLVHNKILASFEFLEQKIVKHTDSFDLHHWMGMALGAKGKIIRWIPPLREMVKSKAVTSLDRYIEYKNLSAKDFANG